MAWARADLTGDINTDDQGAVWIDYVADLGDGFDSTYAIAYLLGRPSLEIGGVTLPRGQLLLMGGDEVYPWAKGRVSASHATSVRIRISRFPR